MVLLTLRSVRAGKHHKSGGEAAQGQRRMALREKERERDGVASDSDASQTSAQFPLGQRMHSSRSGSARSNGFTARAPRTSMHAIPVKNGCFWC